MIAIYDLSDTFSLVILIGFNIGYGLASGPVTWLYMPEILPDIGVAISAGILWFFMGLVGYFFPVVKDNYGISWCFIIFGIWSLLSLIFIIIFIKESKQKSLYDMWKEYGVKDLK